ncbi:transposase [Falsigemmobacter intermedius]
MERAGLAAGVVQRGLWAEACIARPKVLHADNGAPMKGATMKTTLERLGIIASCSRPRVSNDNPFSEALFRTCKYRPAWPRKGFASKTGAQDWVKDFVTWYNAEHLHSALRFVTPNSRHAGEEHRMLAKRADLYAKARAANPQRWTGKARN